MLIDIVSMRKGKCEYSNILGRSSSDMCVIIASCTLNALRKMSSTDLFWSHVFIRLQYVAGSCMIPKPLVWYFFMYTSNQKHTVRKCWFNRWTNECIIDLEETKLMRPKFLAKWTFAWNPSLSQFLTCAVENCFCHWYVVKTEGVTVISNSLK